MYRIIALALLSAFCLFNSAPLSADDGVLLTSFDYCAGHGTELLYNDVNDDLLLMYIFSYYESGSTKLKSTEVRVLLLKRGDDGDYAVSDEQTVFQTTRQIQQIDWAYDPISQQYVIALLNGETHGDPRDIKLLLLGLDGIRSGNVKTLASGNFTLSFPTISIVPSGTSGAPAQARFLFIGRGWMEAKKETGVVSTFFNANLNQLGEVAYSIKETPLNNSYPLFEPFKVVPSGDKKGFLIACRRRENSDSDYFPTLVRLNGNAKYVKHLKVGDSEPLNNSIKIQQVSKKKFAFAWVDDETRRFLNTIVPASLKKAKAAKVISEQPMCTDYYDDPYPIFLKPDGSKLNKVFFVGSKTDMTVYSLLMKKNGKTSNFEPVTWWNAAEIEGQYAFDSWFVAAPIKGTSDFYCVAVLRGEDELLVYGYMLSGN